MIKFYVIITFLTSLIIKKSNNSSKKVQILIHKIIMVGPHFMRWLKETT